MLLQPKAGKLNDTAAKYSSVPVKTCKKHLLGVGIMGAIRERQPQDPYPRSQASPGAFFPGLMLQCHQKSCIKRSLGVQSMVVITEKRQ